MGPARVAATGTTGSGVRSGVPRRLVAALAVTQTVGYGVLHYAFGVLLGVLAVAAGYRPVILAVGGACISAGVLLFSTSRTLPRHQS
ncbi:hypothetical protein [Kribbella sp. NPDC051770]|uniref:hypothetical protein n=1 Tax=Kribbella sp. NPDC051770 TaxID=3155413 RepID=UPI00344A8954